MKLAINIIKEHPLLGIGINNYTEVMQSYDNLPERITSNIQNPVHNAYLLIQAEIGIIGLFFFLCFVILIYKKGIVIIYCDDRFISCLAIGILAGFSGFLIQLLMMPPNMTSPSFLFFWTISGVIVAISYLSQGKSL